VTLVAQAGTFPLTVMLFNRFPVYFLLTNIIIVPLSSIIIVTGCLIPLLYPVVSLSQLLATALNHLTGFTEFLTEKAASLPGSSIGSIGMTVTECILLTVMTGMLCYTFINRPLRSTNTILAVALMISFVTTLREISVRRSNELIVYNSPGATVVGIRTGKILNLYSTEGDITAEVLRHCSTFGLKIKKTDSRNGIACFEVAGRKILISSYVDKSQLLSISPDILILAGSKPIIKDCSGLYKYPERVIISSQVVSGYRLSDGLSNFLSMPLFNIRKSGAFIMRL
jgi:competence protein ComEC